MIFFSEYSAEYFYWNTESSGPVLNAELQPKPEREVSKDGAWCK